MLGYNQLKKRGKLMHSESSHQRKKKKVNLKKDPDHEEKLRRLALVAIQEATCQ